MIVMMMMILVMMALMILMIVVMMVMIVMMMMVMMMMMMEMVIMMILMMMMTMITLMIMVIMIGTNLFHFFVSDVTVGSSDLVGHGLLALADHHVVLLPLLFRVGQAASVALVLVALPVLAPVQDHLQALQRGGLAAASLWRQTFRRLPVQI